MTTLGLGKYLRLIRAQDGYEYIEETLGTGVVAIFAFTEKEEMVLIEQTRPPVKTRVIEMAGGLVGDTDPSESPLDAARRELREETGFKSEQWTLLGDFLPSPAYSNHVLHCYKAMNARRVAPGGGADPREDITVHVVPVNEVTSFLLAKRAEGIQADPKIYMGLYLR